MPCDDKLSGYHFLVGAHPRGELQLDHLFGTLAPIGLCSPAPARQCASHNKPFRVCATCNRHTHAMLRLLSHTPPLNRHPRGQNQNYAVNNWQRIHNGGNFLGCIAPSSTVPVPIVLPANPETPPFPGFLARVCSHCERMIRSEEHYRSAANILRTPECAKWNAYPDESCTCLLELGLLPRPANLPLVAGDPRLCYQHRKRVMERLIESKNRNDQWLRNTARAPGVGAIVAASAALKNARAANGNWRACRCGRELDVPLANAEAFICMACEGHVSVTPLATSRFPAAGGPGWLPLRTVQRFRKSTVALGRVSI